MQRCSSESKVCCCGKRDDCVRSGAKPIVGECPAELVEKADLAREQLIEALADVDGE